MATSMHICQAVRVNTPTVPDWLEDFGFDRIDRARFEFQSLDFDEERIWPGKLARAITDEFAERMRQKERPGAEPPLQWLKAVCYNAILTCIHFDLFDDLKARIRRFERGYRGPDGEASIFSVGLFAIFAHELPISRSGRKWPSSAIDDKTRERLSEAMWWGFRHYADPTELNVFNRENPLHRKTLDSDYLETKFFDQIVIRRFSFDHDFVEGERGSYPPEIEEEVEKLLHAAKPVRKARPAQPWDWD